MVECAFKSISPYPVLVRRVPPIPVGASTDSPSIPVLGAARPDFPQLALLGGIPPERTGADATSGPSTTASTGALALLKPTEQTFVLETVRALVRIARVLRRELAGILLNLLGGETSVDTVKTVLRIDEGTIDWRMFVLRDLVREQEWRAGVGGRGAPFGGAGGEGGVAAAESPGAASAKGERRTSLLSSADKGGEDDLDAYKSLLRVKIKLCAEEAELGHYLRDMVGYAFAVDEDPAEDHVRGVGASSTARRPSKERFVPRAPLTTIAEKLKDVARKCKYKLHHPNRGDGGSSASEPGRAPAAPARKTTTSTDECVLLKNHLGNAQTSKSPLGKSVLIAAASLATSAGASHEVRWNLVQFLTVIVDDLGMEIPETAMRLLAKPLLNSVGWEDELVASGSVGEHLGKKSVRFSYDKCSDKRCLISFPHLEKSLGVLGVGDSRAAVDYRKCVLGMGCLPLLVSLHRLQSSTPPRPPRPSSPPWRAWRAALCGTSASAPQWPGAHGTM